MIYPDRSDIQMPLDRDSAELHSVPIPIVN
jgi:hypothetical protein